MTKPRPSSGDPVLDAVLGTAALLREATNAELGTCGLSLWTFKALRALDDLGPARSVDLGERLGIAARTVTGAVDALEAEGLVERQPHPTDRRAHLLVVTPKGATRLAEATRVHRGLVESVGTSLSAAEREETLALLGKVSAAATAAGARTTDRRTAAETKATPAR